MTATAHVNHIMTTGQIVRQVDGGFHELLNGGNITATGNTGWLDKGFVDEATLHLELGTCTGTTTSAVFVLEQADTSGGAGAVELVRTAAANQDSDNRQLLAYTRVNKRYIRLSYTVSGTSPVFPTRATLQTSHYRMDDQGTWA